MGIEEIIEKSNTVATKPISIKSSFSKPSPILTFLISSMAVSNASYSALDETKPDIFSLIDQEQSVDAFVTNIDQIVNEATLSNTHIIDKSTELEYYSKDVIRKNILAFKALNENWDGFGGLPLEVSSANNALMFIDAIPQFYFNSYFDLSISPYGTVDFAWDYSDNDECQLEIGNELFSAFFKSSKFNTVYLNNVAISEKSIQAVISHLAKYNS